MQKNTINFQLFSRSFYDSVSRRDPHATPEGLRQNARRSTGDGNRCTQSRRNFFKKSLELRKKRHPGGGCSPRILCTILHRGFKAGPSRGSRIRAKVPFARKIIWKKKIEKKEEPGFELGSPSSEAKALPFTPKPPVTLTFVFVYSRTYHTVIYGQCCKQLFGSSPPYKSLPRKIAQAPPQEKSLTPKKFLTKFLSCKLV